MDFNCPFCDAPGKAVGEEVFKCIDCGEYFEAEDETESNWDRSSRHKTRPDDGYDEDEE